MVCKEVVTLEMKTTLFGKPGIRTMEAGANLSPYGDMVQFDLNLQNKHLSNHHFKLNPDAVIRHETGLYQCVGDSFTKGRPHHVVVFGKLLD